MEKALELIVAVQTRMLSLRNERGQGTLEYVGMIIVAAGIILAVLNAADAIDLGAIFTTAVNSVTGGE